MNGTGEKFGNGGHVVKGESQDGTGEKLGNRETIAEDELCDGAGGKWVLKEDSLQRVCHEMEPVCGVA